MPMTPGPPSRTERRSWSHPIAVDGRDRAPDVHRDGSRTGDRRRLPETPACLAAPGREVLTSSMPEAANRPRPGRRAQRSPPCPAGEGRRQWRPGEPSLRRGPKVPAPCVERRTKDATRRPASRDRGSGRIRCGHPATSGGYFPRKTGAVPGDRPACGTRAPGPACWSGSSVRQSEAGRRKPEAGRRQACRRGRFGAAVRLRTCHFRGSLARTPNETAAYAEGASMRTYPTSRPRTTL